MNNFTSEDLQWMAQALRLAESGRFSAAPNPHVACLLVKAGRIIGKGVHRRTGEPHAEVYALREAGADAAGATAYVTLEPCAHFGRTPPCAQALIDAQVSRVVIALQDPNPQVAGGGIAMLQAAGIEVAAGLMESEAEQEYRGFLSRQRRQRPWVTAKLAASLDGRTAMASGESKWITGQEARADVQRLRAGAGAILTGIETVLADDPSLNVRLEGLDSDGKPWRQPLRVVVDSKLRMPHSAKMLALAGKTLVVTTKSTMAAKGMSWLDGLQNANTELLAVDERNGRVDLAALLTVLAEREVNDVFVEAGAVLNGVLLAAGLVDEWQLYFAPNLLGDSGRGLFHLPALQLMADRPELNIHDIRAVGNDWRITARPRKSAQAQD